MSLHLLDFSQGSKGTKGVSDLVFTSHYSGKGAVNTQDFSG